jgi:hypothetical protein
MRWCDHLSRQPSISAVTALVTDCLATITPDTEAGGGLGMSSSSDSTIELCSGKPVAIECLSKKSHMPSAKK